MIRMPTVYHQPSITPTNSVPRRFQTIHAATPALEEENLEDDHFDPIVRDAYLRDDVLHS